MSTASVLNEIGLERLGHTHREGWTAEHDDLHAHGELARAAAAYAAVAAWNQDSRDFAMPSIWPWAASWFKPKDRRRDLIRAAALIAAEIERLDRQAARGAIR